MKDLQTQIQGLENLEKKFEDFQGPARALKKMSDKYLEMFGLFSRITDDN